MGLINNEVFVNDDVVAHENKYQLLMGRVCSSTALPYQLFVYNAVRVYLFTFTIIFRKKDHNS